MKNHPDGNVAFGAVSQPPAAPEKGTRPPAAQWVGREQWNLPSDRANGEPDASLG